MAATVLVVDEKDLLDLVTYHLEKAGLKSLAARDGNHSIANSERSASDLIVLDLMLPVWMGWRSAADCRKEPKPPIWPSSC